MYNATIYDTMEAIYDIDDNSGGTTITFKTLDEAYQWVKIAIEHGAAAVLYPVKE
ncbi:MAG: hypothetical protein PHC64_09785 [Candidatus Gastranaerophilales bacterium]|nr:hypothetical protein [Candidatus Gastranaerophilales bacterium]